MSGADLLDDYVEKNREKLVLIQSLLPYQREVILEAHSHRAILATRRAGKSHACCVALLLAALSRPNAICYYLALTRQSAKKIAWKVLKELCRVNGIKATFSESELQVELYNGGTISLYGVNQDGLLDNLRGTAVDLAVLDEAASFRGGIVEELVDEVLEPAFADYDGKLLLIGTPGPVCAGYFYEATTGGKSEFRTYKWDLRNNTHIAKTKGGAAAWVENHRKRKQWSADNPKFRREYCGEWVQSTDLQVYKFTREKNVRALPTYELTHKVLAIDLGFKDDMAFVVIGYNPAISKDVFVLHAASTSEMQLETAANMVKTLQAQYKPHSTVVDEGGLGKSIAEDWRTRLGISCEAAKKTDKRGYIESLNSDLHEGRLLIPEAHTKLIGELLNLVWDDETRTKEHSSLPNHLCDALLYAWRKAFAYSFKEQEKTQIKTQEDLMLAALARMDARAMSAEAGEWWEAG